MEDPINFWRIQLNLVNGENPEKIESLFAIKSKFAPSEYFNNIGVLYEKAEEPIIAKIFYLRSLGYDFLNVKAWANYADINIPTSSFIDLKLIVFYFLQSNFFITFYLIFCLGFALIISFNILKKNLNYFLIFKRTFLSFVFVILAYMVNSKGFFYFSKKTTPLYAGLQKFFEMEKTELKKGIIVVVLKKNNGYSKIFNLSNNKNEWVKSDSLISI